MIKYVYWRWAAKHEEQHEDSELINVLRDATIQEDQGTALVESITLPDGKVLEGIWEIGDYYERLRQEGKQ